MPDVDALRGIGNDAQPGDLAPCIERVLAQKGSIRSQWLSQPDTCWDEIRDTLETLHAQRVSASDGFTDDEAKRCIARSNIIECAAT
ncbi:MAG: hypothetical protein FJW88_00470 [Actinobacteria bacterium]|nr:hypothetical protein [Actinomycetota bacterium]